MAFKLTHGLALAAMLLLALASLPKTATAARFIVGDSSRWRFGFNYSNWALENAPFYQHDSLVFMYDPPNRTTFPHSVYLMKNIRSFLACDFRGAKLVGSVTQGGGSGLEVVLQKRRPYYFACREHGGTHCTVGLMKFAVTPVRPCRG